MRCLLKYILLNGKYNATYTPKKACGIFECNGLKVKDEWKGVCAG
jgi:hypothetical protein